MQHDEGVSTSSDGYWEATGRRDSSGNVDLHFFFVFWWLHGNVLIINGRFSILNGGVS